LKLPFQALTDNVRDPTEKLRSITTQCTICNEAAQLHPDPSSSGEVSPDVII
jgi:hypothetical protein